LNYYILRAWVRTYAFFSRGFAMSPWRRAWGPDGDLSLYCTHTHGTAILFSLHFEALVEVPLRPPATYGVARHTTSVPVEWISWMCDAASHSRSRVRLLVDVWVGFPQGGVTSFFSGPEAGDKPKHSTRDGANTARPHHRHGWRDHAPWWRPYVPKRHDTSVCLLIAHALLRRHSAVQPVPVRILSRTGGRG
jgi:hypothetical protein